MNKRTFRKIRFRHWREKHLSTFFEGVLDWALNHHPQVKNSNYVSYATKELRIAGWMKKDSAYGGMFPQGVIRQMKVLSIDGHSGGSIGTAVYLVKKLSLFQPLTPLTGEDDEWNECNEDTWQNNRCSHVFKNPLTGIARNNDGKVFEDEHGNWYGSSKSSIEIEFPWTWVAPIEVRHKKKAKK